MDKGEAPVQSIGKGGGVGIPEKMIFNIGKK